MKVTDVLMLTPVFKEMIWGGSRMRKEFGYDIPGDDTGECWAVSAHKNGDCTISGGAFDGQTLSAVWNAEPKLFGGHKEGEPFPLLTKIIDARQNLSIQVHPDDEYAKVHENGSLGKTECWYILDCDSDATIIIGHNAKNKAELTDMIRGGRFSEFIREIPIKKGDFLQIYPGTVHAIKGGTMILETQQNSDITYRVYDYDRLQNGRKRELHVEQSIDVITVPFEGSEAKDKGEPLTVKKGSCECLPMIRCQYYEVWKIKNMSAVTLLQDRDFLICSVIEGEGRLKDSEEGSIAIKKGDHFIIPNGFGEFTLEGEVELICSSAVR